MHLANSHLHGLEKSKVAFLCPRSLVLLPIDAAVGQLSQEGELFWCGGVGAAALRCLCGRGGVQVAMKCFLTASPLLRLASTTGCWSGCSTVLLPTAPWGCSEATKETRFRGSYRCSLLFLLFLFPHLNLFFAFSHACHRRGLSEAIAFGQPLGEQEAKRKRDLAVARVQGRASGQAGAHTWQAHRGLSWPPPCWGTRGHHHGHQARVHGRGQASLMLVLTGQLIELWVF